MKKLLGFKTKMPGNNFAIIFDMDGVVVDNTKYHILTWQMFAKKFGVIVSAKEVKEKFIGRLGREIIQKFINKNISGKQLEVLDKKREEYYRKIYAKEIKPVAGLQEFLEQLKNNNIKVALATAAPPANVKFVLGKTGLGKYFKTIVDSTGVKRGKPNPDVFLKAARILKTKPNRCIVFEDAMMGIEAARRAKMKVVGVATSHKPGEINHTDLVIKDFRRFKIEKLRKLIE